MILKFLKVFFFVFLSSCTINPSPGVGKKVGRIVQLSEKGIIFNTFEGDLLKGGLTDGSGSLGTSMPITIENEMLYSLAEKAMEDQVEVIVHYRNELISGLWRSENIQPNFVTAIERNQ